LGQKGKKRKKKEKKNKKQNKTKQNKTITLDERDSISLLAAQLTIPIRQEQQLATTHHLQVQQVLATTDQTMPEDCGHARLRSPLPSAPATSPTKEAIAKKHPTLRLEPKQKKLDECANQTWVRRHRHAGPETTMQVKQPQLLQHPSSANEEMKTRKTLKARKNHLEEHANPNKAEDKSNQTQSQPDLLASA
jgi:hypothetical protein